MVQNPVSNAESPQGGQIAILIVDDSASDRKLMARIVSKRLHAKIFEAKTGEDALRTIGENKIDLVLLDYSLAEQSGGEVVKRIRETANISELPIVMVSGNHLDSTIAGCLELGANDYITKPIHVEVTVNRVRNQLRVSEAIKAKALLHEVMALKALALSYNHEINNPLTVAMIILEQHRAECREVGSLDKAAKALEKIVEIVKSGDEIVRGGTVSYEEYDSISRMVKLRKS